MLPGEHACPSGQAVHSESEVRLVASEYLPAEHTSAAEAPFGQNFPASHGSHPVAPANDWNVPAAHLRHSPTPGWSLNVPGSHGMASTDPVGQNVPASHTTQSSTLVITSSEVLA